MIRSVEIIDDNDTAYPYEFQGGDDILEREQATVSPVHKPEIEIATRYDIIERNRVDVAPEQL